MKNEIEEQFRLEGKTILVTGASSGIGRQTAIHVSAMGGNVIATGRSELKLNETFNLMHTGDHQQIIADLTKPEDIQRLAVQVGKLDGIIHSAGIVNPYPTRFVNKEVIDEIFAINYNAPVLLMSILFKNKKINRNCSVVFLSSFAAHYTYSTGSLYVSTKAALEAYSKVLAVENASSGLRANCVCPALVKTELYDRTFDERRDPQAKEKRIIYERSYLHGIGMPSDVANAIVFLLSPASKWITGQSIILDGGHLLGLLSNNINV